MNLPPNPRLDALKQELIADIESRRVFTQQMVDTIFSYSELGFQETETQRYVTDILVREGFEVQRGVAGVPTSWIGKYGSGRPIIALGTDIDGLPTTNQMPGVVTRKEFVAGAPGHGEGHNAGQALVMTAALALKKIMDREKLPGTIVLWPGVAEELLGTKAHFVRGGIFKDADAVIFTHVGSNLSTAWGDGSGNGMVSVEYMFHGASSHAAGSPWAGKSALDAVELMNMAWNMKREHLRLSQRVHYVITHGGDQPNVVPPEASVWYFFRETDYEHVKELWDLGDTMAKAAAMMTGTTVESRVLGSAWPQHGNRPIAQAMHANILQVGMPQWSEADQQFARAFQRAMGAEERGLSTTVSQTLNGRVSIPDSEKTGGGSDDIGDVMWNVPTVRLSFPSNVSGATGHHWTSAIAMATPVAHKGATQSAKVVGMTSLDLLMQPELLTAARDYFVNVQQAPKRYKPFLRPEDKPGTWLNKDTMDRFRPELRKFYYDPTRYKSYLEQLGVAYPPPMPAAKP
ncbi:MAG: amidohydrolase [Acidobacteria bacterium RIFCSPLOWO2_02_FULL_65_29]|nr:MAG: amidohydrolase [Acidobacteria bacterium RIFCSPLOWO2_02_FULL_65_29]